MAAGQKVLKSYSGLLDKSPKFLCRGERCRGQSSLSSPGMRLKSELRRHVIIETNKTTARIFPEVPDCETPEFWDHMEKLIVLNKCATSPLPYSLCSAGSASSCSAMHCQCH